MATSKVSRLLIIDLKQIISVFIREIYTFNVKQWNRNTEETVHGHGPKNAWSKKFSTNAFQFGTNTVRTARGLCKQNQKHSRHESTTHSARTHAFAQLKSRGNSKWNGPSPLWHWRITILRCYSFMFSVDSCAVLSAFLFFNRFCKLYVSDSDWLILWHDMSIW